MIKIVGFLIIVLILLWKEFLGKCVICLLFILENFRVFLWLKNIWVVEVNIVLFSLGSFCVFSVVCFSI